MCDRCKVLDTRIQQCIRFIAASPDRVTKERLTEMLRDLKADKEKQAANCEERSS